MSIGGPGNQTGRNRVPEDYSLLRADFEFLASAVSQSIWGDDRYRDLRRKDFLIAVHRKLGRIVEDLTANPQEANTDGDQ